MQTVVPAPRQGVLACFSVLFIPPDYTLLPAKGPQMHCQWDTTDISVLLVSGAIIRRNPFIPPSNEQLCSRREADLQQRREQLMQAHSLPVHLKSTSCLRTQALVSLIRGDYRNPRRFKPGNPAK